jgi:hypothetical protein
MLTVSIDTSPTPSSSRMAPAEADSVSVSQAELPPRPTPLPAPVPDLLAAWGALGLPPSKAATSRYPRPKKAAGPGPQHSEQRMERKPSNQPAVKRERLLPALRSPFSWGCKHTCEPSKSNTCTPVISAPLHATSSSLPSVHMNGGFTMPLTHPNIPALGTTFKTTCSEDRPQSDKEHKPGMASTLIPRTVPDPTIPTLLTLRFDVNNAQVWKDGLKQDKAQAHWHKGQTGARFVAGVRAGCQDAGNRAGGDGDEAGATWEQAIRAGTGSQKEV